MKVTACAGNDDIAMVYIAQTDTGKQIEFVESVQPPMPREKKWVIIVSTLFGCPVRCPICDAGSFYQGKLTKDEIFAQIDFLVKKRFPDSKIVVDKFKIQFARLGEPAFNPAVLEVIEELPSRYNAPGLMPCISTIAPASAAIFFSRLIDIKKNLYRNRFQLQFSIHTTEERLRDRLIPASKWNFTQIAAYGERFFDTGGRKIALNFALARKSPLDPDTLSRYFDPEVFLIKITPINPTYSAFKNGFVSLIDSNNHSDNNKLIQRLRDRGYDVILSIGELEENQIGSNCGQYIAGYLNEKTRIKDGYSYVLHDQI